ncbi:MAG: hypothetical protein KAG43_00690, partial [Candidatus Marithrix sp.]|nr:hypothetical protein [Candidatus Marithrix sp.]
MIKIKYLVMLLLGFGVMYGTANADSMNELFVQEAPSVSEINIEVANYKKMLEEIISEKVPAALLRKVEGI